MIFFNSDYVPVERFIFKLRVNQNVEEGSLEFSLRSFLMKLSVSAPLTKLLPRGNSLHLVLIGTVEHFPLFIIAYLWSIL